MLKEYTIVIIGLGNLGKRHVEALLRSELDMRIYCVDIVMKSEADFDGVERSGKKEIFFVTEYSRLPQEADLAIIATVSSVRKEAFNELIANCKVKKIVFEKVLFTNIEDYEQVLNELKRNKIKAWVNCGRRETEQYANVKKLLDKEEFFEVHVSGGNWGMFCNGIHILDIIACLAGALESIEIYNVELWSKLFEGKRKGFYEAYGTLMGRVSKCKNYTISCLDSDMPLEVMIVSPNIRMTICEGEGNIYIENKENGWKRTVGDFVMPYVSVIMTGVDNRILLEGKCNLPTYEESMKIHIAYINCLERYFLESGFEKGVIPIT